MKQGLVVSGRALAREFSRGVVDANTWSRSDARKTEWMSSGFRAAER